MSDPNPLRECWREFLRGATRPSLAALVITLLVSGVSFTLIALLLPRLVAGPGHRYLRRYDYDTHVHVTNRGLAMQRHETPGVVMLGASLTIRCITSEDRLAELIEANGLAKPLVYNLCTDGQSTGEMAAILDCLRPGFDGVVIIGASRGLFAYGVTGDGDPQHDLTDRLNSPTLGFSSDAYDDEARIAGVAQPRRTGIYAFDNMRFLLARRYEIVRNLVKGAPKYGDPLHAPWMRIVNRPEYWEEEIAALPKMAEHYGLFFEANSSVIGRLVANLRKRGDPSFILMEPPVNPGWSEIPEGARFFRRYHEDLRRLAAQHGMSFLPITEEASIVRTDFVDYDGHIGNPEVRERCTKAIASRVSEIQMEKGRWSR
ncbi:MAG: hypothetical protein ACYTDY_00175 [Planctomycetota bacterium]|jgi:hypothetical protein